LGAVPTMAHWRLSSVPRCLPPADVERLIQSTELNDHPLYAYEG